MKRSHIIQIASSCDHVIKTILYDDGVNNFQKIIAVVLTKIRRKHDHPISHNWERTEHLSTYPLELTKNTLPHLVYYEKPFLRKINNLKSMA